MAKTTKTENKAIRILGKDDGYEFWRSDTAKSIVGIHKKLTDEYEIGDEAACSILQEIWAAVQGEYGD